MNNLIFKHPNAKHNGTAASFSLTRAMHGLSGYIELYLSQQKYSSPDEFNWDEACRIKLSPMDVSGILEVLRGYNESLSGKGFYYVHETRKALFQFSHQLEPIPGYRMDVTESVFDSEPRRLAFTFSMREAILLQEVFSAALIQMTFG